MHTLWARQTDTYSGDTDLEDTMNPTLSLMVQVVKKCLILFGMSFQHMCRTGTKIKHNGTYTGIDLD